MNDHIVEYLNYYIDLENPQYAVLLIGNWGCGKTYFIKELIKNWQNLEETNDKIILKPIYVSLNGVADAHTINERIRAVINPFLYSKGMKVAKSVFKGLLKTTAKIDLNLDDDDKADGNVSFNIDSLGIFDSSNKEIKGKRILIFDDIERCKIKTDEIFGYINNYVEHSGCKVILLSDEKKIKAKYEKNKSEIDIDYKDFKEKLIGQTFEVKSDIDTAVYHFIQESKEINSELDLTKYRNLIIELFVSSELENLRVLKQSLLDFNRLTTLIDSEYLEHENRDEFIKCLLAYFIIVYAEFRTGNDKIQEYQVFNYFDKKEDNAGKIAERKYNSILDKYNVYHSTYVFPLAKIIKYIEKGFILKAELNESIKSNAFFRKDEEQDWERLWWWKILDDEEFIQLRDKVWQQFSKGEIENEFALMHIAGIFISLVNENLIKKKKEFIVSKSKHILNKIYCLSALHM
ncbi:MAG: P-loop NTPase fold protein [Bacteroidales bacterium]|nr:P-loop NTPase fold protein [Bacteroidales bacterium]